MSGLAASVAWLVKPVGTERGEDVVTRKDKGRNRSSLYNAEHRKPVALVSTSSLFSMNEINNEITPTKENTSLSFSLMFCPDTGTTHEKMQLGGFFPDRYLAKS